MAIGSTNVGGAGLAFKVIGYPSLPSPAPDNVIGVVTTTPVTDYIITANQPPQKEGRVWINTTNGQDAEVQVVRRKPVFISIGSVLQSVGGKWVTREFGVSKNGSWSKSIVFLYRNGDVNAPITGGWKGVSNSGGQLTISGSDRTGETNKKIDVTGFKKIWFHVNSSNFWLNGGGFYVSTNENGKGRVRSVYFDRGSGWWSLDVSELNGSYYVGMYLTYGDDSIPGSPPSGTIRVGDSGGTPGIYME